MALSGSEDQAEDQEQALTARRDIMLSRRVSGDRYACVCAFNVFLSPFPFLSTEETFGAGAKECKLVLHFVSILFDQSGWIEMIWKRRVKLKDVVLPFIFALFSMLWFQHSLQIALHVTRTSHMQQMLMALSENDELQSLASFNVACNHGMLHSNYMDLATASTEPRNIIHHIDKQNLLLWILARPPRSRTDSTFLNPLRTTILTNECKSPTSNLSTCSLSVQSALTPL